MVSSECGMSCTEDNGGASDAYFTATSRHTGGVNCGKLDGSVFFVTDNVDTAGVPRAQQGIYLNGASPYGVWGALGTPNGGETNVSP